MYLSFPPFESKTGKTGFGDLVWKPRVLIEMKKREEDLNLDKLVMEAYGWQQSAHILANLLQLNLELAAKETQGKPIKGAHLPK